MSRLMQSIPAAIVMAGMIFLSALDASAVMSSRTTSSVMDSQGNTYVTGWRETHRRKSPQNTNEYISDIVTIKYDKYGKEVWADQFPKNSGWDPPDIRDAEGWAITVDRQGNVYVAGHAGRPGNVDCVLIKYGADWLFYQQGKRPDDWVRTIAGSAGGNDQFWNVAVDPDGFIYATGYIRQANAGVVSHDLITVKYDPKGNEVWRGIYNGPANSNDVGISLVVDPVRRNVFVTGLSNRTTAAGNRTSMITIMYDVSGMERWVSRYDGPVDGHNNGVSLALDPEGGVYVSGWSQGTGSHDFATVRYDLEGKEKWVARYDGPAGGSDQAAPYAIWSVGGAFNAYLQDNLGIHVTAEIIDPVPATGYLMERVEGAGLDRGHQTSLLSQLEVAVNSLVSPYAPIRRNAANLMQGFIEQVAAMRMAGNMSESLAGEFTDIATHIRKGILEIPTNVVYVLGQSTGVGTNFDVTLVKYNGETGRPMWNLPRQPGTAPGKPGTPADIAFRIDGAWKQADRGMAMALNADGDLYIIGMISDAPYATANPGNLDSLTAKLSVNTYRPTLLARHKLDGEGRERDIPCTLATWQDPATGRRSIIRDPVLGDLVVVSGNSAQVPAPGLPESQYFTQMYGGNLIPRWLKAYE